jgi:tetratricopeptide (TPR) repeat protein
MSDYFQARLDAGRYHLSRGRPAQAAIAFRQASYDRARAGEAFNGMAVAYSRLGRPDLARTYFNLAVAADPDDARYRRNLARLEGASTRLAANRTSAADSGSAEDRSLRGTTDFSVAEAKQRAAGDRASGTFLVRASRQEVRIVSSPESSSLRAGSSREFFVQSSGRARERHVSIGAGALAAANLGVGGLAAGPVRSTQRDRRH